MLRRAVADWAAPVLGLFAVIGLFVVILQVPPISPETSSVDVRLPIIDPSRVNAAGDVTP